VHQHIRAAAVTAIVIPVGAASVQVAIGPITVATTPAAVTAGATTAAAAAAAAAAAIFTISTSSQSHHCDISKRTQHLVS